MHKKLQLLKYSMPLLALLVIGIATLSTISLAAAKVNSINSCQLTLVKDGKGNALLSSALAWVDPFLRKELVKYNLECTDARRLLCVLIPNNLPNVARAAERANLDLTNIRNTSPQLYEKLVGQYFLRCGPIVNRGV